MSQNQSQSISNEHEILSKQMTGLSPFKNNHHQMVIQSKTTTMTTTSFNLSKLIGIDLDSIPHYLLKTNPDFQSKISSSILPSTTMMDLEDLRNVAILMHQILSIELIESLWIVYKKMGVGQLVCAIPLSISDTINRKIWPKEVQSYVKQSSMSTTTSTADNEYDACLMVVNSCLDELTNKSYHYRKKLNDLTSRLHQYSRSLECIIEKFVQQNLQQSLRKKIDQDILLIQYYYTDQLLQHAYLSQNPNENQLEIMERLCQSKYRQEMTRHEAIFLKQRQLSHSIIYPFKHESIAQSAVIDHIRHNSEIRKQLYREYQHVAEQARNTMMTLSIECAEVQQQQYHQQYQSQLNEIEKHQNTLLIDQRLTSSMWYMIKQRLTNMTAHIECIYRFKIELIQSCH